MDDSLEFFEALDCFDFDNTWVDNNDNSNRWKQDSQSNLPQIKLENNVPQENGQPWMSKRSRRVISYSDEFLNEKDNNRRKIRKRKDKNINQNEIEGKEKIMPETQEETNQIYGDNIENFFMNVVEAVNESEDAKVIDYFQKYVNDNIVIRVRTPAMTREVIGRSHLVEMYQIFSEVFPDLVINQKNLRRGPNGSFSSIRTEYDPQTGSMVQIHSFHFTGTKALNGMLLEVIGFRSPFFVSSLMDPRQITPEKLYEYQQLEQEYISQGQMTTILAECTLKLYLNKAGTQFFLCDFEWSVVKFRGFGKCAKAAVLASLGQPCDKILSQRIPLSLVWAYDQAERDKEGSGERGIITTVTPPLTLSNPSSHGPSLSYASSPNSSSSYSSPSHSPVNSPNFQSHPPSPPPTLHHPIPVPPLSSFYSPYTGYPQLPIYASYPAPPQSSSSSSPVCLPLPPSAPPCTSTLLPSSDDVNKLHYQQQQHFLHQLTEEMNNNNNNSNKEAAPSSLQYPNHVAITTDYAGKVGMESTLSLSTLSTTTTTTSSSSSSSELPTLASLSNSMLSPGGADVDVEAESLLIFDEEVPEQGSY